MIFKNSRNIFLLLFCFFIPVYHTKLDRTIGNFKIWGPGLHPAQIILPARYFFIQKVHDIGNALNTSNIHVVIDGSTKSKKPCRIWMNTLNRKDDSLIVRYKTYEQCSYMKITVKYYDEHIGDSPYIINERIYSDKCECPVENLSDLMESWQCGDVPMQIKDDLSNFDTQIDWGSLRANVIKNFNKPHSISICHYAIKNNKIYRECYGKYVGFNMFMDNLLLFLARRVYLPDLEFFVNLGDWPLALQTLKVKYPILSWCGSKDAYDIVMPTYDLTEATLENMGRVMLDMLSVQGNVGNRWEERISKLFWRGRDSNRHRLDLVKMSREHPDLFNVSLTNFFFFRDEEHIYGPKSEHISFFKFFDYKYQLAIDGTVASYRTPYLLAGGSLMFKQDSVYYEHFYNDLKPYEHYIPVKKDLSNLVEKIKWAIDNDVEAKRIAENGREFANKYLLPKHVICYYLHLLNELDKIIVSKVDVLDGMEEVSQQNILNCDCKSNKDEL